MFLDDLGDSLNGSNKAVVTGNFNAGVIDQRCRCALHKEVLLLEWLTSGDFQLIITNLSFPHIENRNRIDDLYASTSETK